MRIEAALQAYFQEVCEEVCRRCAARQGPDVEWPPPGTPCGHELHLVQLIEALGLRPGGPDVESVGGPPPDRFCPCAAEQLAAAWGLTVQRHLLRMVRGRPLRERVEQLWTSSGPEKG